MSVALRAYQAAALEALRREVGAQRAAAAMRPASVVLAMPTGAGKTTIGAAIAEGAQRRGRRLVVLTHLAEIHGQWVTRLAGIGIVPGVVTADRTWGVDRPVQVAMVQTLVARSHAPDAEVVLVDEAHHVAADTWARVVAAYAGAQAIVGLTATPERGDGRGLADAFRTLLVGAHVDELVDAGWLLPVRVIAPARPQRELAMAPEDAYATHCAGRRAIVFAANRSHSTKIVTAMSARGIRARHVDGDTPERTRASALAAFRSGELDVLSNVGLFAEGVDAPGTSAVIIARRIQSSSLWLQACGRGMRPRAGRAAPGEHAVVVDLRGSVYECGHPCVRRELTREGGFAQFTKAERLALRACASCGSVEPPNRPACSICGAVFPDPGAPTVREAPLAEVGRSVLVSQWAEKRRYFNVLMRRHSPDELVAAFRDRFGHRPPRRWWSSPTEAERTPDEGAHVLAENLGGG
jgi:superfamily II DNA or RNA helicase